MYFNDFKLKSRVGLIFALLILFFHHGYCASNAVYSDTVYTDNIKTVLCYKDGWGLSQPVIELNKGEQILFSFDDINGKTKDYWYTLIHCDAEWHETPMSPNEYLEGLTNNQITEYSFAVNTYYQYIHYNLLIPNENVKPIVSGNYIIKVFQDNNPEKVILTKRFMVVESIVSVNGKIKQPKSSEYIKTKQEISFSLTFPSNEKPDPSEIYVVVIQNGRRDNMLIDPKPIFVEGNKMKYEDESKFLFDGGNEYRFVDAKDLKYKAINVKQINFDGNYYNFILSPDEPRARKPFFFDEDINGKYIIDYSKTKTDPDYVYVHFSLSVWEPYHDGNLYVLGALSDWKCNANNLMAYNSATNHYELTMQLKQGYYNYLYAFIPDSTKKIDVTEIEGNYYETENDYTILVYQRKFASKYNRLIGVSTINSLRSGDVY
jgi:hypothetical protein